MRKRCAIHLTFSLNKGQKPIPQQCLESYFEARNKSASKAKELIYWEGHGQCFFGN